RRQFWQPGAATPDIVIPHEQRDHAMNYRGWLGLWRFQPHEHADVVKRKLPELWDRAFKFTVERHPYESAVSRAYARADKFPNFQAALESIISRGKVHNRHIYEIDGEVAVDEVIDYDKLHSRLSELAAQWGHVMPT